MQSSKAQAFDAVWRKPGLGGSTPIWSSGPLRKDRAGQLGALAGAEGKGHGRSPVAAPLPSVGAPSRALIGAAAAAGRVSAASLRDATPSPCPAPPTGPPLACQPRGDTEAREEGRVPSGDEPSLGGGTPAASRPYDLSV
jgi:hypothetical protein